MLEAKSVKTEPEVQNIRSCESDKPFLDNRDMCAFMCIICAALITYLLFDKEIFRCNGLIPHALVIVSLIYVIAAVLFWIAQKIVKTCQIKAKRKATDKVGD